MIEPVEKHKQTLELLKSAYKQGEDEVKKLKKKVSKEVADAEVDPDEYQKVINYFQEMVNKHGDKFDFSKLDDEMRYKYWKHAASANKSLHDVLKRQIAKAEKNGVTEFDRDTY